MKIRIVSNRKEIPELDVNEKMIHLAFRPSNEDIFLLVQKCPGLEVLQIPGSYMRTISRSMVMFLEMQKIRLIEGDVWGHRKDINEYYRLPQTLLDKVSELRAEGMSDWDIADRLERDSKQNREMILYIISKV